MEALIKVDITYKKLTEKELDAFIKIFLLILKDYLQCNLAVLQPFEDFDKLINCKALPDPYSVAILIVPQYEWTV